MITAIVLFSLATLFFLWSYKEDPKPFKLKILPALAISFFATTEYYSNLDERIKLSLLVVVILITLMFSYEYYKDYKVASFREKKRIREEREEIRREQSDKILEEIYEIKHGLRKPSKEINLDSYVIDYSDVKQLTVFGDYVDFLDLVDEENLELGPSKSEPEIIDNNELQIGMFHVEHVTEKGSMSNSVDGK